MLTFALSTTILPLARLVVAFPAISLTKSEAQSRGESECKPYVTDKEEMSAE